MDFARLIEARKKEIDMDLFTPDDLKSFLGDGFKQPKLTQEPIDSPDAPFSSCSITTAQIDKWIRHVAPDDRTSDVAAQTLESRLVAVQHYLPLAAEKAQEDAEYVHELRVWTRRTAAALNLYADFLPRRWLRWMKRQLKKLRRVAKDARDYDVLVQRLTKEHSSPETGCWLAKLRARRSKAQFPIRTIHERLKYDDRFAQQIRELLRRVRPRGKKKGRLKESRFGDWARASLRAMVQKFFKAAPTDGTDLATLHKFRIRGKRLRYGMELLAGAFPRDFREKLYPIVETLQDKLGEINDRATAQVQLRQRIKSATDKTEATHLRKRLADERARLEQLRRAFLAWCTPQFLKECRAGFEALDVKAG
jgi:CHAD domain-containing protein